MRYIVVGCGRLGSELSFRLFQQGHQVAVVDHVAASFERLNPSFRGRTVEGDSCSQEILERAGIIDADGLAAVTNVDSLNAVVAHVAKSIYKVSIVVARNYDPKMRSVMETFGLQTVSSTSWGAQRIEELLTGINIRTVYSAGNGEVEIYQFGIPEEWHDHMVGELVSAEHPTALVALTRAGISSIPTLKTIMRHGDLVDISTTAAGIGELRTRLLGKER